MRISDFSRWAFSICAGAAMLPGCGGSPPPIGAPGVMPQSRTIATHADRSGSWMLPEARGRDLLYISKPFYPGPRDVYVFTYPRAKLVGLLAGLGQPEGECADKSGNVFITSPSASYGSAVYEYAHGSTNPIATLDSPYLGATGCSVDPASERLAISGGGSGGRIVSIFAYEPKRGWRFPKTYSVSGMTEGSFCGYDNEGNLFVDGITEGGSFELAELPKGASAFTIITLNQNINAPGQVEWDGKHLAVGDAGVSPSIIYQFSISGSSGAEVGSTTLTGSKMVEQFWIQGKAVIGPDFSPSGTGVGFWPYPGGGNPDRTISLYDPFGATVSLAK
jgi:hypothetical protein